MEYNNLITSKINNNKNTKKRNYIEIKKESQKIQNNNTIKDVKEGINLKSKKKKIRNHNRKFLPKFLKDNDDNHYYYHDNNNREWEFLEIQGSNSNFYFKCSTAICRDFGMILRTDNKKIFKLTKLHPIDYYNHSYYINKIIPKELIDCWITKELWKKTNKMYLV